MNRLLPVIFFLFVLNVYSQTYYESSSYGYNIILPDDWEQIPKSTIDNYVKKVTDKYNLNYSDYETGFQLKSDRYFTYPYILLLTQDRNGIKFNEYIDYFEEKNDKIIRKIVDKFDGSISIESEEEFFVDYSNDIMYVYIKGSFLGNRELKGVWMIKFYKDYIVNIYGFERSENFASVNDTFLEIIYSLY